MPCYKVALLVCDTPPETVVSKYGDYPKLFHDLLRDGTTAMATNDAAHWSGVEWHVVPFDVINGEYPSDITVFDAMLISGSKSTVYHDIPWINTLKEKVKAYHDMPACPKMATICFGHQIITEAFGGKCANNPLGWEVGYTELTVYEKASQTYNDLMEGKTMLRLQSMHKDHTVSVPKDFDVLAGNEISPNQVMINTKRDILTVQAHPEFTKGVVEELVKVRASSGIFNKDFSHQVLTLTLENDNDSTWFGALIVRFFIGASAQVPPRAS